jgi:hypothetical protein
MSILQNSIVPVGSTGYDIPYSARFNDDDSAYLSRTPSTAGNRKTWTYSCWVKRGALTGNHHIFSCSPISLERSLIAFNNNTNVITVANAISNVYHQHRTVATFRDTSAWYHIVVAADTTQAVDIDRCKIYINGVLQELDTQTKLTLNEEFNFNSASLHHISSDTYAAVGFLDGYLAEVNFVDGQALTPADFGETDEDYGHWKAIEYTGTYGTNGFYLDFKNSGSLGNDASSNSNNWTPTNLAATDQMLDSPTNNFCTLNPLHTGAAIALSEGNLKGVSGSIWRTASGTLGATSGKWYWEQYLNYKDQMPGLGWTDGSEKLNAEDGTSTWKGDSQAYLFYEWTGGTINAGVSTAYASAGADGALIGIALDIDNGKIWFSRNGVWLVSGNPSTATSPSISGLPSGKTWLPFPTIGGTAAHININFGQDSSFAGNKTAQGNADGNGYGDFYYAPPTGFLALCTQNLPEPAVVPSEHFNTVLYTGTSSSNAISGVGFNPDLVWGKSRSAVAHHGIYDVVRGATKELTSTSANSEVTETTGLTSFDSDGFSLGSDGRLNTSGTTYASWNWKANGAGVSNTNGTITSTVSANADAGFSIVSYTGNSTVSTIGHGLSQAPEMIVVKNRDDGIRNWGTYTSPTGNSEAMFLNITDASAASVNMWASTSPTTSVFSVGIASTSNLTGDTYIAYCFHSVDGYSKVGSYTGNGSADGTFVHCGFRPAYVMVKSIDVAGHWQILDNVRDPYNAADNVLIPNISDVEYTWADFLIDYNSNGFKLRGTSGGVNTSGTIYMFLAFAEHPFKYTNAR